METNLLKMRNCKVLMLKITNSITHKPKQIQKFQLGIYKEQYISKILVILD